MEAVADRLLGIAFASFSCSPVPRALESAEIPGRRLCLPWTVSPGLAEWHMGVLEGTSADAGASDYNALCEAWYVRHQFDTRIPGGESFEDIRARFVPFIERLLESDPPEPVLVLAHGGIYRCMMPIITSNISFEYVRKHALGYGDVVIVEHRPGGLVCVQWGAESLRE